jgi:hypothetical protein
LAPSKASTRMMRLPHGANLDRMKFSERTGGRPHQ